jgi:hypothetical protein
VQYQVKQQGQVLGTFPLFVDAWLFVVLDTAATYYYVITDTEGETWIVNPPSHSIN